MVSSQSKQLCESVQEVFISAHFFYCDLLKYTAVKGFNIGIRVETQFPGEPNVCLPALFIAFLTNKNAWYVQKLFHNSHSKFVEE